MTGSSGAAVSREMVFTQSRLREIVQAKLRNPERASLVVLVNTRFSDVQLALEGVEEEDAVSTLQAYQRQIAGADTPPRLLSRSIADQLHLVPVPGRDIRVTGIGGTVTAVLCNDIKVSALLRDKLTHELVLTVEKFLTPFVILDAATAPTLSPQDVSGDPHDDDSNVQPMDIGAILEEC
ncbi:hypothetical protein WJX72_007556 [[Myrmecia] bisecta]|uniref:Uncharacterized protein n=1 Tax=[Myrmecia] bisecta TaxID=41462 RepID=A0AAW1P0V3_9CHLO